MEENEINRETELQIYKDKFVFNRLIKFAEHAQKYNEEVSELFLISTEYSTEELTTDDKIKSDIKYKIDTAFKKVDNYKKNLENDLIFLHNSKKSMKK